MKFSTITAFCYVACFCCRCFSCEELRLYRNEKNKQTNKINHVRVWVERGTPFKNKSNSNLVNNSSKRCFSLKNGA